jgi:dolichol-phosphate mannosyltransferase
VNSDFSWVLFAAELVALAVVAPRLWRASRGGRRLDSASLTTGGSAVTRDESLAVANISVVVPARNEAIRIAECLAPLREAPGVREVIVVDDESSDSTASVAHACGATVLAGKPLPAGWVGKIWALQQGIEAAQGEVIVTLDADARPDRNLARVARDALVESNADLATVASRFRTTSRLSQWLHAAMLTTLVYRHGAGAGTATTDAVANGQCMVFRRGVALREQWCNAVRSEIIEDVALVRHLVRHGKQIEMFDGSRLLTVQMFNGFVDTLRGWGRSLALAGVDRAVRQWIDLVTTALVLVAPLWFLAAGVATPATLVALAIRMGTLVGTRRAYERSGIGYWLSPLADVVAWLVVVRGVVAPSRQWRGRQY